MLVEDAAARRTSRGSGPVGAGVPDDFSVRMRATLVPTGIRRVDVQRRAGRPRARADRRRGGPRQLEPDRARRRVLRHGQRGARRTRSSSSPAAATTLVVEAIPAAPALGGLSVGLEPPRRRRPRRARGRGSRARADAVVCVVGSDGQWETEGNDRESMTLPGAQDDLVRAVAAANPRTVVVVNAASPVAMPWADDVAAILQCWFAGEEWGNALADVLSGDVSPSGQAADDVPGPHRGHARVHELSRRGRQGALRRRRVRRLPLVRRAPHRAAVPASGTASRTRRSSIGEVAWTIDDRRVTASCRGARDATPARGAAPRSCSATSPTSRRASHGRRRS